MASIVADEDVFLQFKEESTWHSWKSVGLLEGRPEFNDNDKILYFPSCTVANILHI
jgi:hypothetical protein